MPGTKESLKDKIGFTSSGPAIASPDEENHLHEFVNLKLASRGYPIVGNEADYPFLDPPYESLDFNIPMPCVCSIIQ